MTRTAVRPSRLPDPTRIPRYRWVLLVAVMLCSWTITWYSFAMGIILPSMSDDLGLGSAAQGWLSASFFLGSFIFMVPLTNVFSRFPPVHTMSAVLVVTSALLFAAAAVPAYPAQLGIRFVIAVVFVAANPIRTLLTQERFRAEEYALANGVTESTFGITEPIAFWLTAPLLTLFGGWQGMFVFFGLFGTASSVVWIALAREPRPGESLMSRHSESGEGSPLRVIRHPEVWWGALAVLGFSVTWSSFVTFWPTFAQDTMGMTEGRTGVVLGFTSAGILPFSLLAPVILRRVGRRVPVMVGVMLLQVPFFGLMLVTDNLPALIALSCLQGVGAMMFAVVLTMPFQLPGVTPRETAAATAIIGVVSMGGLAAGPAAVGMIGEVASLGLGLAIAAFMPLVSATGAFGMGEPKTGAGTAIHAAPLPPGEVAARSAGG